MKDSRFWLKTENYANIMKKTLPVELLKIINIACIIATRLDYRLFLIGGIVRDILLGVKSSDIDLVVEGDGIIFAKELNRVLQGDLTLYKKYMTAKIVIDKKIEIDMTTARQEFYNIPATLPQVEESTIKNDLARRDFTINTLALSLNNESYGNLLDLYGGKKDLINRKIKVLHSKSFIDDPIRILRAIRFKHKLKFEIEDHTLELAKEAINSDIFSKLSLDRVLHELHNIFEVNENVLILRDMNSLNILTKIFPEIRSWARVFDLLDKCNKNIKWLSLNCYNTMEFDKALLNIATFYLLAVDKYAIVKKFRLSNNEIKMLKCFDSYKNYIIRKLNCENVSKYEIADILKRISGEHLILLLAITYNKKNIRRNVKKYIEDIKQIELFITGKDIKKFGIKPGPIYKTILDAIYKEKINGNISTKNEEITLLKEIMKKMREDGIVV